ncbi:hypothetical protein K2224_33605 (plasmid) [Streptomyces sp. BHT-5-2]|uniref:hypothetical protein n=1 Tax=Streptomyces sp. BHT-5-2 TaxID=2866715 RepID=UPI001C8D84F6|nr:hypothetical protein [Streptomyces sp. BHT-5-2]QZL08095.1 hypothetical protein K2224_33605 [Streptomyces sp. BHT-5-2]
MAYDLRNGVRLEVSAVLDEAMTALAAAGGTAVVQAAGTDAWAGLRQAIVRLFGRGDDQRASAALERLDGTAAAVSAADGAEAEQVRTHQEAVWQGRFEALMENADAWERDSVIAALRALVAEHYPPGQAGGGEVSGNTFNGPTIMQVGTGNRQDNRFGNGA